MSLVAKGSTSNFVPAPEGMWNAVCVDVVDLGMVEDQWGVKHKCRIVWEIEEKMDDGRPFLAAKKYTVSLHEKASLHKDLKAWRGKAFTSEEIQGFDVEKVIGAPCRLVITHVENEGTTYANVTAAMKADPKHRLQPSGDYVRVKDREGSNNPQPDEPEETETNDEPVPF